MIPNEQFLSRLTPAEDEVLGAFERQEANLFIEEWHRGAYKTTLAINLLICEACRNKLSKYLYIAPTQVWARNIVWDDPTMLWGALPDKAEVGWEVNEQRMLITFQTGSMLKICGSDDPDAIRGIDFDGVVCDEWSLHDPVVWTQILSPIMARARRIGSNRDRWVMFLYTPKGSNHATQMFDVAACVEDVMQLPTEGRATKCREGWFASRLTADKSGIIPQNKLLEMKQQIAEGTLLQSDYDQEMLCRRVTDEERTLITSAILERLNMINWEALRKVQHEKRRIVAIDPAFGGDVCSIKGFENGKCLTERAVHYTMTSEVVMEAKLVATEIKTKNFIVDCIGVGKGVADGLSQDAAEYYVQYFNSAGKIDDSNLFANLKAKAVYHTAQQIRQCKVEPVKDSETRRQLIALSRYKVQQGSGKMLMIANDDVKKAIGCSPDKGLCYVYGIYGLQFVRPEEGIDDFSGYFDNTKTNVADSYQVASAFNG
jgi:hypothetical protein